MKVKALSMLKLFSLLLLILIWETPAWAQTTSRLQLDSLDRLTSKASQTVAINIDERVLKLGAPFLKSTDPNEAKIKELLDGIKGIYVKSFLFDNEGEFSDIDMQAIRSQLNSPDWLKIVEARSRKEGENVDVFIKTDNTKIEGIVVIAFNSKELTVINIVGSVDMDKLSRMEGQFGIPDLELERESKENRPQPEKKN
jgi:hypothetical protein